MAIDPFAVIQAIQAIQEIQESNKGPAKPTYIGSAESQGAEHWGNGMIEVTGFGGQSKPGGYSTLPEENVPLVLPEAKPNEEIFPKPDWLIDFEKKMESWKTKPDWLIEYELNFERLEKERLEAERLTTVWTSQKILDEIIKKFKK